MYELNPSWPVVFSEQWNLASNRISFLFFLVSTLSHGLKWGNVFATIIPNVSSLEGVHLLLLVLHLILLISWQHYRQLTFSFDIPFPSMGQKIHLSHFIIELKINHLHSLITTRNEFDNADPTSTDAGCLSHMKSVKWSCSPWVLVAQWIERPLRRSWVRFLLGTQIFLCPTLVSSWLIHLSHLITELKINCIFKITN